MNAEWKRLDRHGLSSEPGHPVLMSETVDKLDEYADRIAELEAKLEQATAFIEDFAGYKFELLRAPNARHPADQEDDATPLPMVEAYQEDARDILAAITNPGGVDQPHITD